MKILHLASFIGNIGDNASHMGFRNILNQVIEGDYTVDEFEIRKFYKNYNLADKQKFDNNFADRANKYDLLFIGGGGFLDYWVKGSQTGTTIDISEEVLDRIKIPVIIGSVGSFPHKAIPPGNIEKFERFLRYVQSRSNMHILLRNDGSKAHLTKVYGEELINDIPEILDHAFFYQPQKQKVDITDKEFILINTTLDQLEMQSSTNELSIRGYHDQMRVVLNYILTETEYDIVFAPHIYRDVESIIQLLSGIDEFHIRSRIKIASYCQGNIGSNYIFNLYAHSELNIGMRFHSNVFSLVLNNNTIALCALDRVLQLTANYGVEKNQRLNLKNNFSKELVNYINKLLSDSGDKQMDQIPKIVNKRIEVFEIYKSLLSKYNRNSQSDA